MSTRSLFRSFRDAGRGVAHVFRTERSFRIHAVLGAFVLIAAIAVPFWTILERALLLTLVGVVLTLEIANSVAERLVDALAPRLSLVARDVKDMMAGAVLVASITATAVAAALLFPHVLALVCATLASCNGYGG